jgi:PadR family transcriptional regulator, regulatory protein PadR
VNEKELMGASTTLLVLSVLAGEASYGYQIVKRINDEAEGLFTWQEGTIYPVLHRLEKEGLVRAQWQDAGEREGGRRRKYYYITALGRQALQAGNVQWKAVNSMITRMAGATHGKAKPALG